MFAAFSFFVCLFILGVYVFICFVYSLYFSLCLLLSFSLFNILLNLGASVFFFSVYSVFVHLSFLLSLSLFSCLFSVAPVFYLCSFCVRQFVFVCLGFCGTLK